MIARLCFLFAILLTPICANAAGGVVSAADPRAAAAGQEMLRAGGSASDAALAIMLALTVVEPQSSGIGGGGFLVHHDGKSGSISTIDGRETAPAAATPDRFMAGGQPMSYRDAVPGGKSVGVPGNIRLMAEAHRKWGKLPWAKLFDPAIRLAEGGFAVTPRLNTFMGYVTPAWKDFPETAALYMRDGKAAPVGTIIRNPALARLLKDIAKQGPDAFYKGQHATAIAAAVTNAPRNPVPMTLADLAAYQAKERPALCGQYRQYRVCGMGPPSSGAVTILQMLGMIERFDMGKLGKDSPEAWHLIGEAMQLAYADREKYLADADFVSVPVSGLVSQDYLARRSALISPVRALAAYEAGTPPGAEARTAAISGEVSGTTHFVAVDGNGDVVSMTSTVEGPFGSQILVSGMMLNNELTDFTFAPEQNGAPVANRVEPGKRPLSSMSPTIVYGPDGKVVLAVGSAGGKRIIMHVMKALVGVLDWKLSAADAVALPNLYFGGGSLLVEKGTSLDAMRPELEKLGQPVTAAEVTSKLNAIERVGDGWRGVADPRTEGVALAE